ncbi:ARID DNA-binding domain containing protein [Trema orientale]|uniref:ARID DNA-binding domain containing protein n=1 Tax=Trema orientale TaxID=63057 RepID=A0A2P5ETQ0_TREOI|nr:ARID DNA-binding domain containing protein [Trema orientale]
MHTHHHSRSESEVPTPNPSSISAQPHQQQQQQQLVESRSGETANGLSISSSSATATATKSSSYPSATAKYEQVIQSSDLFWEKLKDFHSSFATKFMIPTVGGKALDLHRLFVEVTSRGGLETVIRERKWKEVIMVFNFPTTITSASFVLRKYYLSLLYHFEQVYYFHKQAPSISVRDPASRSLVNEFGNPDDDAIRNQLPGQANMELQLGCSVTGAIDGKFDNGYLVTVNLGSEQLNGVLYHAPLHMSQSSYSSDIRYRRNRKKSRLALRDPSRPKSNRSGYNFFFAEHYTRLKPMYYGQEKAISKKIGVLWNNLTEAEKQVYQEKGLRDKERYRNEMLEYKSSSNLTPQ